MSSNPSCGQGPRPRQRAAALAGLTLCAAACLPAQAALVDRGGGMIYDTVLDITWLADANQAQTSGFDADGRMSWAAANTWAADLQHGGFSDWRLPTLRPIGSSFDYVISCDATTDRGFAKTTTDGSDGGWRDASGAPVSELGHMYYVNLANLSGCFNGAQPGVIGLFDDPSNPNDESLFVNLQAFPYWTDKAYEPAPALDAWAFSMITGNQISSFQSSERYAWAVRDGDVLPIPTPATLGLVALGLAALGSRRRQFRAPPPVPSPGTCRPR